MQAEQVQILVQQAAAGNVDAFVTLIQTYGHGLRLALAAHLEHASAIAPVEVAVWSAVRRRLGEWLSDTPFLTWVQQIAVESVQTHLNQADRRAIDTQDVLTHQIIEHCREALSDGQELGVVGLGPLVQALSETTKHLLARRYRERQRTAAIASASMISEVEVAHALMAARAACDWRQIARPPAPGDRLLPPLIEDWLSGTIDVDSRSLLATNLGRDFDKAAQFARQVRVHVALGALLSPFGRDDAVALVRQTGLGSMDSSRVMLGEPVRPASGPRSAGSDINRPPRMTTSNRQVVPVFDETPRSSPLPWILGGGMVLIGVIALVATSVGSRPVKSVRSEPPVAVAPATSPSATPPAPSGTQPNGGVLRVDPGRPSTAAPPPRVALTGQIVSGRAYIDQPLELRAELSHTYGVTGVEFWKGEERVASLTTEPFIWTWAQPVAGPASFTVRVIGQSGTLATSTPAAVTVHPAFGSGNLMREWWDGVGGTTIAEGVGVQGYPDRPQGQKPLARFASRDRGDDYLERLRGFVVPPVDGEYVFWIAGDDESELWLSQDETRSGLRRIAVAPFQGGGGIGPEEWERDPSQRSAPLILVRGRRYYVEVLHKEAGGDGHVEVGWKLPDGTLERPIPGAHLSPPTEPVPPAAVTVVAVAPTPAPAVAGNPGGPVMQVLWDGETKRGGSGFSSGRLTAVAGSGRGGGLGLQSTLTTEYVNMGWNWFGWSPDDAGTDVRTASALALWLRFEGANLPTHASLQFLSSPKSVQARSASIDLAALVPSFADGQWHQVVIPLERLSAAGFDLAKVWEFNLKCHGKGVLAGTVSFDDVVALSSAASPLAVVPMTTAPTQLVRSIDFVSSGAPYVITEARNGEPTFVDREWRLAGLPPELNGGRLIRTRNGDDNVSANPHLRFTTEVPTQVYVAFTTEVTTLPAWLQNWSRTETVLKLADGPEFRLFRAEFPAGQVALGGSERNTSGAKDNYFVLVKAMPTPPKPVAWKPVCAINLGGEAVEAEGLRFKGHRQAEAEGQTQPGTNQLGPWLIDLPWVSATSGQAKPRRNRSVDEKPLTVAGKVYERGIGTHAPSEIVYDLGGRYSGLTALVGIDDEVPPDNGEADVIFQVFGDGKKLFDSGSVRRGSLKPVAVPLTGVKELKLVVDPNGGLGWDHADWLNPQLLRPGGNDGVLMVRTGRRAISTFSPKPAVDAALRGVLGTSLAGTKEGLDFSVRVPNGPSRVYLLIGEPSASNSRQFDVTVEGVTLPALGLLPASAWTKVGPVEVVVTDGTIDVSATAIKGIPQVMGIIVEQPQP